MTLSPRPTFTQIAHGEHYARRVRRAAAVQAGKLSLAQARADAAAWDAVIPWADALYCIAGPWPVEPDRALAHVAAAAQTVAEAAASAQRRAAKDAAAAAREGRIPADLTALAEALADLATKVPNHPTGSTGATIARHAHKIPADACAARKRESA